MRDRLVIVTGASRGIGAAIALRLAETGLIVACISRSGASATIRLTRPMRSASSAPTVRPVRIISRARASPISRGSRCVPP